jgi:hypothetical protein
MVSGMEVRMELAQVEQAALSLLQAGLTWQEISAPKIRDVLGAGSYRDILKHLRTIKASAGIVVEDEPREGEEPGPEELPPPDEGDIGIPISDPVAEAEAALRQAQQALQGKMDALPAAEAEMNEARSRLLEAVSAQLASVECGKRGLLPSDDPGRVRIAAEVGDATAHFQQARLAWQQALQGIEGWSQRCREAEGRVQEARRQAFLQAHHPALVQALQDALEAQARDPWLAPEADRAALQAVQHTWQHRYVIEDIRRRMQAVCEQAGL